MKEMTMKKPIYGLFMAAIILTGMPSCSDNLNEKLEPIETVRTLTLDVESPLFSNGKLSLGAAPADIVVAVESNTRWSAEVTDCDGGWCEIDAFNGSSNGSFTISVRENMKENRTCYVKVYKTNAVGEKEHAGSQEITVSQVASDVRLYPGSVEPFPADPTKRQDFEIISNVPWNLTVNYEVDYGVNFVSIITTDEGMTENADGSYTGTGNAKFQIDLQPNRTAANRSAFLTLTSAVSNYTVELSQLSSEYTFDVTPSENQVIPATGGDITFRVLAICGWNVSSAADWITFSDEGGNGDLQTAEVVTASVKANANGYQRTGIVRFTPTDNKYEDMATSVTIVQRGYDLTFSVSPNDDLGVVLAERQNKVFDLDSRFNWHTVLPDWITATPEKGEASVADQKINIEIAENSTGTTRNGTITFYPDVTLFDGDVSLDPSILGIEPLRVNITQFGGNDPAISVPWLAGEYSQTSAVVEFNFYSPFYPIYEAGLEWKKADEETWNVNEVKLNGDGTGKVTVELSGLDPATEYVARGYVIFGEDNAKKYGVTTIPFTTAGKRPGSGDNPAPGV